MTIKDYITYGIIAVLIFLLSIQSCRLDSIQPQIVKKNDTIYIDKPYKVETIKTIEKPVYTIVYKKDTNLRQQAEKQTIITKVQFVNRGFFGKKLNFNVDKIDLAGNIFSSNFQAKNVDKININGKGEVEIKRKKYITLQIIGSVVLTSAMYAGGKYIYDKKIK